jgi:uncharacterized protein YidB (DUF937 family)
MSGFLGSLTQLLGIAQGAAGGDLPALLLELENAGMAEHVLSWKGEGEHKLPTIEELRAAIPPARLQDLANQAGISAEQMLRVLAEELPDVVREAELADSTEQSSVGGAEKNS